jgi:hypothetical protein
MALRSFRLTIFCNLLQKMWQKSAKARKTLIRTTLIRLSRGWLAWAIALVWLGGLITMAPAQAAPYCRTTAEHTICVLSIKRSAKNYWEYRATVRVDGIQRPIELYNCRDRLRIQKDGIVVPFEAAGAGSVICQLFDR